MKTPRIHTAKRIIHAPAESIYPAMTDADQLKLWLAPDGAAVDLMDFDLRPGGQYRMVTRFNDPDDAGRGRDGEDIIHVRFIDIIRDQQIVQAVDFESDDPDLAGTMRLSWILDEVLGGTRVIARAEHVPPGIEMRGHEAAMSSSLERLAHLVEESPEFREKGPIVLRQSRGTRRPH